MSQGGHIVKPSGKRKTWTIIYRDPAGIQQREGKFKKRTAAQTRLNEVLGAIDKGSYARSSSVTFEKFAEDWLAGRRQIRGSTESGYGSIINKQLVPRLGAIAVSALRFEHVDAAQRSAEGFRVSRSNDGLELPPLESRQITPPTPEQVWALIGAAKELGGLGYALAYTGAFTGLRRNEALGLRFNDIEWFGNEVNVRHAISKRRGTDGAHKWEWHVGPPKSRKSSRRIAATESVMKMLADLSRQTGRRFHLSGRLQRLHRPGQIRRRGLEAYRRKGRHGRHALSRPATLLREPVDRSGRNRRLRSRPDGPLQHQGYLRYLWASLPRPRKGSQRPLREVDG
jgi:integrase